MTARNVSAEEALGWGLVNRVVEQDQLLSTAIGLAQEIMQKAPLAVGLAKLIVDQGDGVPKATQMAIQRGPKANSSPPRTSAKRSWPSCKIARPSSRASNIETRGKRRRGLSRFFGALGEKSDCPPLREALSPGSKSTVRAQVEAKERAMSSEVAELIRSLTGPDAAARQDAAERLSQLGPDAQAAAVPLVEACETDEDALREKVTAALQNWDHPCPVTSRSSRHWYRTRR